MNDNGDCRAPSAIGRFIQTLKRSEEPVEIESRIGCALDIVRSFVAIIIYSIVTFPIIVSWKYTYIGVCVRACVRACVSVCR